MTERVSSDASRHVCRRPEDDDASQVANDKPAPAPACRDRLVSAPPPDWDRVPNSCDENAAMAARNATSAGMCGGGPKGAPVTSSGTAPVKSEAPPPPPAPAAPPASPTKSAGASTNAARTNERDAKDGPYVAAGWTHDGKSVFVGAAATKGKTGDGGEVEKLSASVQVGRQSEAQVTGVRHSYGNGSISASNEAGTANAHYGTENSDGSRGLNVGATLNAGAAEVTITHSGSSATVGVSEGIGAESHVGIRDADKDGAPEVCVRVGALFFTVGACFESPIVIRP